MKIIFFLIIKGNIIQSILQVNFLLDTFTSFTLICTIWWPPLRYIFIPLFLNCWLAKRQLENSFNDLHRAMQKSHSALAQRLMVIIIKKKFQLNDVF
jgi:potassium channel subfamily T protein 1